MRGAPRLLAARRSAPPCAAPAARHGGGTRGRGCRQGLGNRRRRRRLGNRMFGAGLRPRSARWADDHYVIVAARSPVPGIGVAHSHVNRPVHLAGSTAIRASGQECNEAQQERRPGPNGIKPEPRSDHWSPPLLSLVSPPFQFTIPTTPPSGSAMTARLPSSSFASGLSSTRPWAAVTFSKVAATSFTST